MNMSPSDQLDYTSTAPPEILAYIFRASATLDEASLIEVVISHVCSRWRLVALQHPPLWSRLELTASTHPEKVLAYLARSKTLPLDLSFKFSLASEPRDYIAHLNALLPHSPRWRRLSFTSEHPSLLFILPELCNASLLEEVSVTLHAVFHFPGTLIGPLNQWLSHLPTPNRLKKIDLDLFHPQEVTSAHTLKLLISASPGLENLSLHGCGITMPASITQPIINASSLRSLSLRCTPSQHRFPRTSWLHCLDAPNLQFLELKNIVRLEWPLYRDAIETGTYSALRKLRLVDVESGDVGYSFAENTPKLELIEVVETRCSATGQLILKLIIEDAVIAVSQCRQPIWPALRTLGFSRPDLKLVELASISRETVNRPITSQQIYE